MDLSDLHERGHGGGFVITLEDTSVTGDSENLTL